MDTIMWVILALGVGFAGFLLYTRQFKWLLKVGRNMVLGAAGIIAANAMLSGVGLAVGVNFITAMVVGVLGIPGFMMLYLARLLMG
jgi:inhibitor of the pro-sigma K processing machinery